MAVIAFSIVNGVIGLGIMILCCFLVPASLGYDGRITLLLLGLLALGVLSASSGLLLIQRSRRAPLATSVCAVVWISAMAGVAVFGERLSIAQRLPAGLALAGALYWGLCMLLTNRLANRGEFPDA